jgi:hypothetical protein
MSGIEKRPNGDKRDLKTGTSGSFSCGAAAIFGGQTKVFQEGVGL